MEDEDSNHDAAELRRSAVRGAGSDVAMEMGGGAAQMLEPGAGGGATRRGISRC